MGQLMDIPEYAQTGLMKEWIYKDEEWLLKFANRYFRNLTKQ